MFDRYMKTSLKEQMRTKRTKGKSTYYHVKDTTVIRNISLKDFLSNIRTKAQLTEADTLLILHDVSVPHEAELVVSSPDNDVLLLLVHMYPHLPVSTVSTVFLTGKGRLKRNISVCNRYNNLGQKRASALLGLHALTGSDMSGRFAG